MRQRKTLNQNDLFCYKEELTNKSRISLIKVYLLLPGKINVAKTRIKQCELVSSFNLDDIDKGSFNTTLILHLITITVEREGKKLPQNFIQQISTRCAWINSLIKQLFDKSLSYKIICISCFFFINEEEIKININYFDKLMKISGKLTYRHYITIFNSLKNMTRKKTREEVIKLH